MQILSAIDRQEGVALLHEIRGWLSEHSEWPAHPEPSAPASSSAEVLMRHGLGGLRPAVASTAVAIRHGAMVRHAARISAALHDAGIGHALLRGPVSAAQYPWPAGRYFSDLDLLVGRPDLADLRDVFQRIGLAQGTVVGGTFQPADPEEIGRERREKRLHAFIGEQPLPDGRPLVVEVHHQFLPVYAVGRQVVTGALSRTVTVTEPATGTGLPALDPLDRAVELCTHLEGKTRHLPALRSGRDLRLGLYVDLAVFLADASIAASQLVMAAERLGYRAEVDEALRILAHVVNDPTGEMTRPVTVHYFAAGENYRGVAEFAAPFAERLATGSSLPFLTWLVDPHELDEAYVQHTHQEGAQP
jgi:hypothetical protein